MSSVPTLIGHIRSGRLRGLAVTSLERSNDLPDVPTVAESGYAGFEAVTWFGLAAPAGTPPEVVGTLNAAFNKALADKDLERKFEIQGAKVLTDTPETFGRLIHDDRVRWAEIIKESGAHID
jgi:tripartite-type tricarboxylate transporter receptor subunit TctC